MNLEKIYNFENYGGISGVFSYTGSNGVIDGYENIFKKTDNGFETEFNGLKFEADIKDNDGVFYRKDTIYNTSEEDVDLFDYKYRFSFEGGECEVYTQHCHWQGESTGAWQELVTKISAESKNIRSCEGAVPMVAVWNKQTNRGMVFHIFPQYGWDISVTRKNFSCKYFTTIEISINDAGLKLKLPKGEKTELAPVLYYEFTDKKTLDSHKLHAYLNKEFPRKKMPVLYNTWLTFFDRVDLDLVLEQIKEAADIGCDYFALDAGWFGKGTAMWDTQIGNWVENQKFAYKGRMREVSDAVHEHNMKFGLWLEPERALANADIVSEHPEYFITNNTSYFIDFANDEAREYITNLTLDLIEKYNIDMFKFDFNDGITYDPSGKAFYDYRKGHIKFIKTIREKYPDIYIENCASGGLRMDLESLKYFDSVWFSDNQSAYEGMEIIKNTSLRFPPSSIERWSVLVSRDGFVPAYATENSVRTMSTDNATWDAVISVTPEYMKGFFSGGPVGISFDLTKLDKGFKEKLKEFIRNYKNEQEFWINAACRLLTDSKGFFALQFEYDGTIKVVIYTNKLEQTALTVYPVISENRVYKVNGEERSYQDIITNGVRIENPENRFSYTIEII